MFLFFLLRQDILNENDKWEGDREYHIVFSKYTGFTNNTTFRQFINDMAHKIECFSNDRFLEVYKNLKKELQNNLDKIHQNKININT